MTNTLVRTLTKDIIVTYSYYRGEDDDDDVVVFFVLIKVVWHWLTKGAEVSVFWIAI